MTDGMAMTNVLSSNSNKTVIVNIVFVYVVLKCLMTIAAFLLIAKGNANLR